MIYLETKLKQTNYSNIDISLSEYTKTLHNNFILHLTLTINYNK